MKLSDQNIEILREKPAQTQLHLSIFQPRPVMKCRVNNATGTFGDRLIYYDTVSFGNRFAVEEGMTLLVGTSTGNDDLGRIRIRSVTSTHFVVSENSNIHWANNAYLTVLRYWELWPVYPRIIQKPSDPTDVIFYKDYDIAYADQNSDLGTLICAGAHRAAFLDAGQAQLYYTAAGSHNLKGEATNYHWAFEGGTPTGSEIFNPGYISYTVPGHYVTRLIVSGTNGESDTTYRYVSIYDRPENGTNTPPNNWKLINFAGSRDEGGYTATIEMHDPVGDIYEGALVVIFADDWYGGTKISLGGNSIGSQSIVFVGYVLKGSINWKFGHSYVSFDVGSITEIMKKSVGFSISVESKSNPKYWYELLDMDSRRALYHYMRWQTTILTTTDFQWVGDDFKIQYFDTDRASMYDAVNNYMQSTVVGKIVSDRQGKIWAEVDAEATPNATGTFTNDMQITNRDWINQPILHESVQEDSSYIEYGGIAFLAGGTGSPFLSCAPGQAPAFHGKMDSPIEGLALTDQAQLNELVGNIYANRINKYKSIDMELAGNYRNLDIAPQSLVSIIITPQDTDRGILLSQSYVTDSMDWTWSPDSQFLHPNVTFKSIISGPKGETIPIPPPPPPGQTPGPGPIPIPPFPIITGTNFASTSYLASFEGLAALGASTSAAMTLQGPIAGFPAYPPSGTFSSFYTDGAYIYVPVTGIYRITHSWTFTVFLAPDSSVDQQVSVTVGGGVGFGGSGGGLPHTAHFSYAIYDAGGPPTHSLTRSGEIMGESDIILAPAGTALNIVAINNTLVTAGVQGAVHIELIVRTGI